MSRSRGARPTGFFVKEKSRLLTWSKSELRLHVATLGAKESSEESLYKNYIGFKDRLSRANPALESYTEIAFCSSEQQTVTSIHKYPHLRANSEMSRKHEESIRDVTGSQCRVHIIDLDGVQLRSFNRSCCGSRVLVLIFLENEEEKIDGSVLGGSAVSRRDGTIFVAFLSG